jgi:molybdopterin-guanine dinucleotide biosynthesis protein A
VILAGGKSRRMGHDKLLLEVGGEPMLRRVCDVLSTRCAEIVVVGGGGESVRLGGARRVFDERRGGLGPLAGLEAGLAAARNRLVFVAAGDVPFLSEEVVCYLLERLARSGVSAVVPRHRGETHPLCAAYDREVLRQVRSALDGGVRSVREFLEGLDAVEYVEEGLRRFGDPDRFLMNVNSPEDLERARTLCEDSS